MDGPKVYGRRDVASRQFLDELIAPEAQPLGVQAQHVEMPRVLGVGALSGRLEFVEWRESGVVALSDLAAPRLKLAELAELAESDRRGEVRHVVLEARPIDFIGPCTVSVVPLPGVAAHPVQAPRARHLDE